MDRALLWTAFSNDSVFGDRFRRCSVDDSRIRSKTAPFSFENGLGPVHTNPAVFKRKRSCFVPDTAIVYTTTPKTITENGAIRKRSPEWSDLKTMLFENAVF